MKFLRKINIGLILTIIVVAAVAIYSVNVEVERNKEKDNIKATCEEFIKLTSKCAMLPEEYQDLNKTVTEEQFNTYVEDVTKSLKEKMIDNDEAVNIQKTILEAELANQIASKNVVTKFERNITKINSYAFDGDQVTVTFKGNLDRNIKYLANNGYNEDGTEIKKEETKPSSIETTSETITLQKIDNTWKVVYSNLQYSDNMTASSFNTMMYM